MKRRTKSNRSKAISGVVFSFAALAAFCIFSGCVARNQGPPNVVLITMDTTRTDYIGAFGAKMADTPALDGIARDGAIFTFAHTAAVATTPSHTSLLSSMYPLQHGTYDNETIISDKLLTMQKILKSNGYGTAAFVSSVAVGSQLGFSKGFDTFDDNLDRDNRAERRAEGTTDAALKWLEANGDKPFFMWVHYYDPHTAYNPPKEFRNKFMDVDGQLAKCKQVADGREVADRRKHIRNKKDRGSIKKREFAIWRSEEQGGACVLSFDEAAPVEKALYAAEISYMDSQIGRLTDWFKKKRKYKNTMFIAISDHGETLDEIDHGMSYGHTTIYEEVARVPLIIKAHGRHPKKMKVDAPASSLDVMPTVLQLLNIKQPEGNLFSGVSLANRLMGKEEKANENRPLYFEAPGRYADAVVLGDLKYVFAFYPEKYFMRSSTVENEQYFDLKSDPLETKNLKKAPVKQFRPLTKAISEWREKTSFRKLDAMREKVNDMEFRKRLKQLGYL